MYFTLYLYFPLGQYAYSPTKFKRTNKQSDYDNCCLITMTFAQQTSAAPIARPGSM